MSGCHSGIPSQPIARLDSPRTEVTDPLKSRPDAVPNTQATDAEFIAMLSAYRSYGGLMRCTEADERIRCRRRSGPGIVLHWVRLEHVFSFVWKQQEWMPAFQLDAHSMLPRPEVRAIVAALRPRFDAWQTAIWFIQPNAWLDLATPVSVINFVPHEVLLAAKVAGSGQK